MKNENVYHVGSDGVVRVELTQRQTMLADQDDWKRLRQYRWYAYQSGERYYAATTIRLPSGGRRNIQAHRMLLGIDDKPLPEVDHINGNGLDNRHENLRTCTHGENVRNRRFTRSYRGKLCASQFKGVSRHGLKWQAQIGHNGRIWHLGTYEIETDAARAYDKAALRLHGQFAKLNKVLDERDSMARNRS